MMKKGFGTKPESKLLVLIFALVISVLIALYAGFVAHITIVYTHLFYVPILLAGMWYKRKAVAVALFLGIVHILVTHFSPPPLTVNEFGRAAIFIVVAYVIGLVSEQRAKGEDALRESEEKYSAFFKASRDSVFITSKEGRWLDMNDAAVELLGYESKDELLKVNVPDLYKNLEERQRHLQLIEQQGFTKDYPVDIRRKDGRIISTLITSVAKKDVNGNVIGYQGTIRDITDRKKAEDALRASEAKFRTFVDTASDLMLIADKDGNITDVNQSIVRALGYSKEELLGLHITQLLTKKAFEKDFEPNWEKFIKNGEVGLETTFATKDGKEIYGEIKAVAVYDRDGEYAGARVVFRDLTERKNAEEVLQASEEKYRLVVENANEAIVVAQDGMLKFCNPKAVELTGYSKEELTSRTFVEFIHPDDLEMVVERHHKRLKGEELPHIYPFRLIDKGGNTVWVEINAVLITWEGRPTTLNFISDVTERKQAEKERESLLKELEAKNKEMEWFTYTVSHDLRSPLITIQGFTDMVQTDLAQNELEKAKDNLKYVDKAATKMEKLLSDTLQLSRIGRMANPPEDVPFGKIVEDALEQTAEQIKSSGVEVSVAEDFPTVHVDRMRIAEMLVNLIVNSINYGGEQPHPKIEIGHRIDNGERVFFVQDNGIGIDPGQHEKVFDLFYQVDESGKGTGAGLAIVKRIIEVHGGRIWIESEKGKGCTVCFTLPVK